MKRLLYLLFILPLSVLSTLSVFYLSSKDEPLFFLKSVKINGVSQLGERDVINKVLPFLNDSLLKIDISRVKEAVVSHPVVREVRIKRVYPFSLVIDVQEKTPSALWVDGAGQIEVLDERGEPFRRLAKGDGKGLFIINAKEQRDATSLFREVAGWIGEGIVKRDALSDIAYHEGSITLFGWEDGVEIILGKEDQRGRLKRAMAVLEDARKRGLMINCIDARFEQGAIIQERKG
jgi:cell division protein FtsQ